MQNVLMTSALQKFQTCASVTVTARLRGLWTDDSLNKGHSRTVN